MPVSFNQRVGVFVDVQNMFYATKNLYSSKLNYSKLLDYITRGRDLVRSLAYVVATPEIDQSNFLTMLRSNGYEVRTKELRPRPDGSPKGDWDMGLALDAISMAEKLDVIAIVSGDGDFSELVEHLKARGVRVEVYSFPYSTAEELRSTASEFYQMGPEIVMNPTRAFANIEAREGRPYRDDEYAGDGYREGSSQGYAREAGSGGYARGGGGGYARGGQGSQGGQGGYGRGNFGPSNYGREGGYAREGAGYGGGYRDEYRGQYRDEYREPYADGDVDVDGDDVNLAPEGEAEAPEAVANDQE